MACAGAGARIDVNCSQCLIVISFFFSWFLGHRFQQKTTPFNIPLNCTSNNYLSNKCDFMTQFYDSRSVIETLTTTPHTFSLHQTWLRQDFFVQQLWFQITGHLPSRALPSDLEFISIRGVPTGGILGKKFTPQIFLNYDVILRWSTTFEISRARFFTIWPYLPNRLL